MPGQRSKSVVEIESKSPTSSNGRRLPKEAACKRQLPSPVVDSGHSRSQPSPKHVHQFSRVASCSDTDMDVSISSLSKNRQNSSGGNNNNNMGTQLVLCCSPKVFFFHQEPLFSS